MKNILVPVGNTEKAVSTLQYATDFAHACGGKVYVMRAYTLLSRAGALSNVDDVMQRTSRESLESLVNQVDKKEVPVKVVTYKGDVLDGIRGFERAYDIDLIIVRPRSTDVSDQVYLGSTSGSIVKQTRSPVLVVPEGKSFTQPKNMLLAFKYGSIQNDANIEMLSTIEKEFGTDMKLLLVKTPTYSNSDLEVSPKLVDLSSHMTITENATTYQGVLEHFRSAQPDMLCVFRRKRGFFEKLWERNTIQKKDFYMTIPLLVLKGK